MPSAAAALDFFSRNGLGEEVREKCLRLAREGFGDCVVVEVEVQGGCSFTVGCWRGGVREAVVQFRLERSPVDFEVVREVWGVYGGLVPRPLWERRVVVGEGVGLQCFAMEGIEGVGVEGVQPRGRRLGEGEVMRLGGLMRGLAGFFAMGWRDGVRRGERQSAVRGRIGASVVQRLAKMERGLPGRYLRREAFRLRDAVEQGGLDSLPVVLSHGDLLPCNVMVDPERWQLTGLIDWAEAEYLPFGMTLYGVQHLLGYLDDGRFVYYCQAREVRQVFWSCLLEEIPELSVPRIYTAVLMAWRVGILLWHGIAWDDGRLDRVVNGIDDGEELAYLEAFLEHIPRENRSNI